MIDGRVPGDRDAAIAKYREYAEWLLGLAEEDGMFAVKYLRPGVIDTNTLYSGDGTATCMAARMCHLLWKATGETRWCEAGLPRLQWIARSQFGADGGDPRMEGAVPTCRWIKLDQAADPQHKFPFMRSISTTFAMLALCDWMEGLT